MKAMLVLIVLAICSTSLQISTAQSIVLFGDSLSDNGNGYAGFAKFILRTNQTYPEEPYYLGRWSNGPTWIEVAASKLGVDLIDYSAAGATTGSVPAQIPPLPVGFAGLTVPTTVLSPSLPQQLDMHFLKMNNTLSATPQYFIFFGANDNFSIVFQNTSVKAETVTGYIRDAMQQVYDRGARKFVLVEVPDLTGIPAFTQHSTYGFYPVSAINRLAAEIKQHNSLLQGLAKTFPANFTNSSVYVFDFGEAFHQVVINNSLGLKNLEQACYVIAPNLRENSQPSAQPIGAPNGVLCKDPDSYVNWDQ